MDQLKNALIYAQKLEKKLRQLRNRKEATEEDVEDAKEVVEILREIADRRGIAPIDIDAGDRRRKKH